MTAALGQDDIVRRELARGTQELAILFVLSAGARYGYDLLTGIEEESGGALEVKEGTLYPILHRLEDAGCVEAAWEAEGRSAPRKYYSLTKTGETRLRALREEWRRLVSGMSRLLDAREDA